MSDFNTVSFGVLTDPNQVWGSLDSFWRKSAAQSSAELVQYQTYAALLYYLANNQALAKQAASYADFLRYEPYLTSPWFALVVYEDQFINSSYPRYNDGDDYSVVPDIFYGQAGNPTWIVRPGYPIADMSAVCDAVVETTKVIDRSRMFYDRVRGELHLTVNLFTEFPVRVDQESGRNYVVMWCRNVQFDNSLLFDCVGWQSQLILPASEIYAHSLALLRDMTINGVTVGRIETLLNISAGLPAAEVAEPVRYINDDGWRWHIITDTMVYSFPNTLQPTVSVGTMLRVGQGVTSGVVVANGAEINSLSMQQLPGVVVAMSLSTGVVAKLTFQNTAEQWTYDVGRPSAWRFPIGGTLANVEQYWVDTQARQTASGVYLDAVYGLIPPTGPAVVPMQVLLTDVLSNMATAVVVNVADIPHPTATIIDRIAQMLPAASCLVIQQRIEDLSDTLAVGGFVDAVTCNVQEHPTDTVSVSGTDLILADYVPLVVIS